MPDFMFDNSFARLPAACYRDVKPTPVPEPKLVIFNRSLADDLGIANAAQLPDEYLAAVFSGNMIPGGAQPLAMAYAGHQFGHFVPALGDGRAILLGEVISRCMRRYDLQLKGAGRTPFSRQGDGRYALGPALREYLISEAMHALGIPTTRSLSLTLTGEPVWRQVKHPGAVLCRLAESHLRIGTFQYFSARNDLQTLQALVDYSIARLCPEVAFTKEPLINFIRHVQALQASLVAQWMAVGFIHGVMNTDNVALSGETLDYGPCAFMDTFDPDTVFSSIDTVGRYSWGQQPQAARWNLARWIEALLPLFEGPEEARVNVANMLLAEFDTTFEYNWHRLLARKLGIVQYRAGDENLAQELLSLMAASEADFTDTFSSLADTLEHAESKDLLDDIFVDQRAWKNWQRRWLARLEQETLPLRLIADEMRKMNPVIIPRNHVVESVIAAAEQDSNFVPFHQALEDLRHPWQVRKNTGFDYSAAASTGRNYRTFCGT